MSEEIRLNLSRIALIISIVITVGTVIAGVYVVPYRISLAEERITVLEAQMLTNRELLVRIDENVKTLKEGHAKHE